MRKGFCQGLQLMVGLGYGSAALGQTPPAVSVSEADPDEPLPEVVIELTPVRGSGLPQDHLAGSAQRMSSAQIRATRGATLADALQQNVAGITLNDAQGNALLPDLSYRGFTASPLLGLPQGLAVYQNGTRLNEPFGDTLGWELVPEFAIDQATLVTGVNPIYGLNALGGALSLRLKNGFSFNGVSLSGMAGSFGRLRGVLEAGLERAGWAAYAGGDLLREDGWRDHSPSDVRRLYVDLRHREESYELALNASLANSDLTGNGPSPVDLLSERRPAVFTYPDQSKATLALVSVEGGWALSRTFDLNATAYVRSSLRRMLNGDEAELEPCEDDPGVLCEEDEDEPVPGTSGDPIPAEAGGDGALNTTRTSATSGGGTLQLVARSPLFDHSNQLTLGIALDAARTSFHQRSEVGSLREDRGVDGSGFFRGDEAGEVGLRVYSTQFGAYGANTFDLTPQVFLTLAGRMNWVGIRMRDRIGDELDGDHSFARFNPAAGVAYAPSAGLAVYANYSEANRAPTAAELSCADPEAPCRLPNAFLSDPPLEQVVTRSVELGARLRREFEQDASLSVSVAAFASRNLKDILFVAGSVVGTGYFRNAGTTQRAGLEASISARLGKVEPYLNYQLLLATFESSLVLPGDHHPEATETADGSVISVEPGDRMPGVPVHSARLGADVKPLEQLSLGAWLNLNSSQYYRGDEANLLRPLPGYVALNARASYDFSSFASVFLRADNLLNASFETFGLLGQADEVIPDAEDPRFLVPSAPRSLWVGLDVQFGK
ncbi:MAG: TonB-dependent receptor [Deltaproteobacteria bacterium]